MVNVDAVYILFFFAWTIPLSSVDHAESHYIASISEIVAAIKDEYTAANLH